MSRDPISESGFGNQTGQTCKEWRNKPSGRYPTTASSHVGWNTAATNAGAVENRIVEKPANNVPMGLLVIALVWIGPIPRMRQLPASPDTDKTALGRSYFKQCTYVGTAFPYYCANSGPRPNRGCRSSSNPDARCSKSA